MGTNKNAFDYNEYDNDDDEATQDFESYVVSQSKATFTTDTEIMLDSEKSHEPLYTKDELSEKITFLCFDLTWMFIATLANVLLFVTYSYEIFFDKHFCMLRELQLTNAVCDVITIFDIVVVIVHSYWKRISQRKGFAEYNKALVTIDIISLASIVHDVLCSNAYENQFHWIKIMALCFVIFRMYRVVRYFYIVSLTPGLNHIGKLMQKYGIITFLIIHSFSCFWQHLEFYRCVYIEGSIGEKPDWDAATKYMMSIYYVMCQISTVTIDGKIECTSPSKNVISIGIMIIVYTFMCGVFVGAWTSAQVEGYRRHAEFARRLTLINEVLSNRKISRNLRRKAYNYYITYWYQQGAIQTSVMLQTLMPMSIRAEVFLDKYWYFLQQSYLLMGSSEAFLRAVAMSMQTQIYTKNEVIIEKGKEKNSMSFLVRGSIQILSAEDNESPILTLGMGTLLGEASLVLSSNSPVQVIASSYCIIQRMNKCDFWRIANKYINLKQNRGFHNRMEQKILSAWSCEEAKETRMNTGKDTLKMLKVVKAQLTTEQPRTEDGFFDPIRKKVIERRYSDLYILSKQEKTLRSSDEICLHTTWPWILQPQSLLLDIWEYLVCSVVMLVAIVYPYQFCFENSLSTYMRQVTVAVDTIYFMDIVLQIFTAVEDGNVIVSLFVEIVSIRCRQILFILDLIATAPLDHLEVMVQLRKNDSTMSALTMLRIFKFLRVITFMGKLGTSFNLNVALVRCLGYVMYLLLTVYFLACIYYMWACYGLDCDPNSWMSYLIKDDAKYGGSRYGNPFVTSMYSAMMLLSQIGFMDLTATNLKEVYMMLLFFVVGLLCFSYLVADYSATLMLAHSSMSSYIETTDVIRNFMTENQLLQSIQNRANEYLTLQWRTNEGFEIMHNKMVLHDAPRKLFKEIKYAKFGSYFAAIPLFQGLEEEILRDIIANCHKVCLPPNEIIIYAGEISRDFYIIEKGFCTMMSVASGKVEKILGPKSHFLCFEMLLALPGIFNISTVTNVHLVKLSFEDIKNVLKTTNISLLEELMDVVKETATSLAVERLFMKRGSVVYQDFGETEEVSWFVFPKRKLHPRNIDYERGFLGASFFKFFRVFLLRRTLMPYGRFIMYWEISRAVSAFFLGMIYPPLEVYQTYFSYVTYFKICLDVFAFVDIYIRMHVCYYNKKGILVTHPRFTAINYFSRAFLIDLLGATPTDKLLHLFYQPDITNEASVSLFHKIKNFLNYNRLLQLYRLPDAFAYWQRDILKSTSVTFNIVKFIPLSLIFINVLTSTLIIIMCDYSNGANNTVTITPKNNSWIKQYEKNNLLPQVTSIKLYIIAFYWMTSTSLSVGFTDVIARQASEMYFIIFSIVAGYLMFKYVLVIISSSIASININLTLYQKNIKQLIAYMEREKIGKNVQEAAINHFEYIWQRTHGVKAYDMIKRFHLALHQDLTLSLYEVTFTKVPVFADCSKSFYRLIGVHIEEAYYLKGTPIIKLNDIVSTIFIVHKGSVVVKGPDGSTYATLGRGCMFGNIDNIRSTRSLTLVIAEHSVDLLFIKTKKLYELSHDYPSVISNLQRHILYQNLSYIRGEKVGDLGQPSHHELVQDTISPMIKLLQAINYNLISMLAAYASFIVETYLVAFQEDELVITLLGYTLDVLHIIKLVIGFYMPYQNNLGELITDLHMIRKRYMTFTRFYAELLALFPLEILAFVVPDGQERKIVRTWMRLNRVLRLWIVVHYFDVTFNRLNIKVEVIKLGAVCVYFSLMLHTCSCILFIVGCPFSICAKDGWTFDENGISKCDPDHYYMCSLYFMTTLTTCACDTVPRSDVEIVLCTIIIIFSAFLVSVIIGDLSSIVQNYSYTLVNYDYSMSELKIYLKKSMISEPLIKRVVSYANQLWAKENGRQVPEFLCDAPSFLKEEIKAAAYGKHLFENYVFVSCHNDFLRLLIAQLRVQTFFAGDMICLQGDVNNKMYFIHKGCVEVLAVERNVETLVDELYERDCFGLIQGLFVKTPHLHSYRAMVVSVILSLELKDWLHLMKYYPAARFLIYERIQHVL